ncbi:unnamed protein product [Owenia fusiformis]|uniref:Secreted protein n=1 Tax=Owenia fusiformis TaxID=6347 RepID=A0A8S4PNM7_OWEFU|nr:unnamed protein product [Owenia fusiformis]
MLKGHILLLTISLSFVYGYKQDDIVDCGFYDEVEAQRNMRCGIHGFPIGFGKMHCQELQAKINGPGMTEQGKAWALSVLRCMVTNVKAISSTSNCADLSASALHHADCYFAEGKLCTIRLCPTNRYSISLLSWKRSVTWNESYKALTEANGRCPTDLYKTVNVGGTVRRYIPHSSGTTCA